MLQNLGLIVIKMQDVFEIELQDANPYTWTYGPLLDLFTWAGHRIRSKRLESEPLTFHHPTLVARIPSSSYG